VTDSKYDGHGGSVDRSERVALLVALLMLFVLMVVFVAVAVHGAALFDSLIGGVK
jgi:hypothetical protein